MLLWEMRIRNTREQEIHWEKNILIEVKRMVGLTELGIFISSLLLSLAGCVSVICSESRRSRCTRITFPCCQIHRDTVAEDNLECGVPHPEHTSEVR